MFELRLAFGPGYRIYFTRVGALIVVLLAGGDKGSQTRDIAIARAYLDHFQTQSEPHGHS